MRGSLNESATMAFRVGLLGSTPQLDNNPYDDILQVRPWYFHPQFG